MMRLARLRSVWLVLSIGLSLPFFIALSTASATPEVVVTNVFNQNRNLDSTGQEYADDKCWWINE